jgi:two-component system chemotaxis response regulator CheB
MVVDDSAVIRVAITRTLESDPDIRVVRSAGNGELALQLLGGIELDVVILDIEMPVMDGLTALPQILEKQPNAKVVVASTLSQRGAEITLRALQAGAADCIAKPSSMHNDGAAEFRRDLVAKVKALARARRSALPTPATARTPASPAPLSPARDAQVLRHIAPPRAVVTGRQPGIVQLRPAAARKPRAIAIGSSTGGPQAVSRLLAALSPDVRQPIFLTQHMPPTFTAILAQHLAKAGGRPTAEGRDGEMVEPGRVYVAPGDHHMVIRPLAGAATIALSKEAPENFCRPSVDPMLRSLVAVYGPDVLCVILTGMGSDGLRGGQVLVEAGGTMLAQDEASSVVWGMPGAVANAGLCSVVAPIESLAEEIARLAMRGER